MKLKSLTSVEFDEFAKNYPISNFYQTSSYALLMGEYGYEFEYLGLLDDNDSIVAGSLILFKAIRGRVGYGYAPNGFLLDYNDPLLIRSFTDEIRNYYSNQNIAFIKINPLVITAEFNKHSNSFIKRETDSIKHDLINNQYIKLKDNLYFESSLPRFDGFINLKNSSMANYSKNTRNKIRKALKRGLVFEKARDKEIDTYSKLIYKDIDINEYFYKDLYNIFKKNDNVDLFLVKIDYEEYLINSRINYDKELQINNKLNEILASNPTEQNIANKMNSDMIVESYKNDIVEGTKGIKEDKDVYVAGALVVKNKNMVSIISSWYDHKYAKFDANYLLHHKIIEYYKDDYDVLSLNGMTGDFSKNSSYYGLNMFKLGFNPDVYEFIGEFDMVINLNEYMYLQQNNYLAKEFNKKTS